MNNINNNYNNNNNDDNNTKNNHNTSKSTQLCVQNPKYNICVHNFVSIWCLWPCPMSTYDHRA